jgi:hypothetical protein
MQSDNKTKKDSPFFSEFSYDDAFRTMETECDDIVIPFVNYFYNENYDENAQISRLRNEHFIEHEDQSDEKRITDSHFKITQNGVSKIYHIECESSAFDNSILVRMFEYDSQIALDESEADGTVLRVRFPYTGLLLLRRSDKAPGRAEVIIQTPKGEISYDVTIMKMSDFTIDRLFENRLYLMIPFYIFNYERQLKKINLDDDKTEALAEEFRNIMDRLDEELDNGKLSALSHNAIIRLTHKVVYKLSMNHEKVQEKVGGIMGGKVLDLPDFKVFREGKAEGLKEGKAEGLKEGKAEGLKEGEAKRQEMAEEIKEGEAKRQQMAEEIEALKRELEQIKKDKS